MRAQSAGANGSSPQRQQQQQQQQKQQQRQMPVLDEVLELNVGGDTIMVKRSTLIQIPGSRLAIMFCGQHDENLDRDSAGRIFIDFNPYCFRKIVDYLRCFRIAGIQAPMPVVSEEMLDQYNFMAEYLGLPPPANSPIHVSLYTEPTGTAVPLVSNMPLEKAAVRCIRHFCGNDGTSVGAAYCLVEKHCRTPHMSGQAANPFLLRRS